MKKITLRDRFRYAFDNIMARGTKALVVSLAVLSLALVLISALLLTALEIWPKDSEGMSFWEATWQSLATTFEPSIIGDDTGWKHRLVMFIVALGGLFVTSTFIGVLTSGVEAKVEDLRKGRSRVIEKDHTIILGWSQQTFDIVSELVAANQSRRKSCIVVLGEKDKVEMEDEIRDKAGDTGRTRVVCRTGNPIELTDLEIVNLNDARAIIVPSPPSDDPDSDVIKIMLAIVNNPNRRSSRYNIVADIRDPKNMEVARIVGKGEASLVLVGDLIARIVAQTCRQSGLSVIYSELLDFAGDEIYIHKEPSLAGSLFGDALLRFRTSALMGILSADGAIRLCPPMDTVLKPDDELIVIAEDDDKIAMDPAGSDSLMPDLIRLREFAKPTPERTLILGWNWRAPTIIRELDAYVGSGSEVVVVGEFPDAPERMKAFLPELVNQRVGFIPGETTDRRTLDNLEVNGYKHVIVLSYSDTLAQQQADARTLVTLLHLREIAEKTKGTYSVVSEMCDVRNRVLAEVTRADDFIVSDKLVSLMLSQVAERKELNQVFAELFDPSGAEIYLKLASYYIEIDRPTNFYTVVEAARRRGEVAIGYRVQELAGDRSQAYGVVVNPDKSKPIRFARWDRIIVVSQS